MKRLLCIVLAVMMCLSLLSCGEKPVQEETPPPVQDVTDDPVTDEEIETDVEEEDGNTNTTKGDVDVTEYVQPDEYFYDPDFDYMQNPRFSICLVVKSEDPYATLVSDAVSAWCDIMNLDYTGVVSGEGGEKEFVAALEEAAHDNDGVILCAASDFQNVRYAEILNDAGCKWLNLYEMRDYNDVERSLLSPALLYNYELSGKIAADFLLNYAYDNYGSINNVGWVYATDEDYFVDEPRNTAFRDTLYEHIGYEMVYDYDVVNENSSIDDLYDHFEHLMQWHPEINHWLCYLTSTEVAEQIETVTTDLGIADKFLILVAEHDTGVISRWDAGEEKYIGIMETPVMLYAEALVCGIYSMITGNFTQTDLWAEWVDANELGLAKRIMPVYIYTPENYKEVLEWTDAYQNKNQYSYDVAIGRDAILSTAEVPESYTYKTEPTFNTFSLEYAQSCELVTDDYTGNHPDRFMYRSIKDLSYYSPEIIIGKIVDVNFTNDDINPAHEGVNYPYTVYTVEITETIRGGLEKGTQILVLEEGGYVHWEKYNSLLDSKYVTQGYPHLSEGQIAENFYDSAPILPEGTEVMLFLYKSFMECYEPVGSFRGIYIIENGEVWRYIDSTETYVFGTVEEAKSEIEANRFNLDKYTSRYGYYN